MTPSISRCQRQATNLWKNISSARQHLQTVCCPLKIGSQRSQYNMADSFLLGQFITDLNLFHASDSEACQEACHDCTYSPFQWWWTGTYKWEEKLCPQMSPDSACSHSIIESKFGEYSDDVLLMLHCNISGWSRRQCWATEAVHTTSAGYGDSCLLYKHVFSDFHYPNQQTWVNT